MFQSIKKNVSASYHELVNKVTWPSWPSLISSTVLVLVASVIFALLVLVMDTVSNSLLELLYSFGA